jgi:hypothetical protein
MPIESLETLAKHPPGSTARPGSLDEWLGVSADVSSLHELFRRSIWVKLSSRMEQDRYALMARNIKIAAIAREIQMLQEG